MAEREIILSPEGKKAFEAELSHLKLVRRREVAERIKAARVFGDLSENAEYEDAKKEQAFVEARIFKLENILRHAVIAPSSAHNSDVVCVGSTVTLKDVNNGKIHQYTIVGSQEADPGRKRISHESPVGRAVLGQKPGTVVTVTVPAGTFQYEIASIDQN
ncbi:MAG TPA: transcription elongation factor GreA [Firmicutes bacterium]|nr:transcription elongation factor GreA [Bacillota bacterium]